jgi:hypothetical protein
MLCDNYSKENKQCMFNYTPHPFINGKDLNPLCKGENIGKNNCICWSCGSIDLAGNDKLRSYLRKRLRDGEICHKT